MPGEDANVAIGGLTPKGPPLALNVTKSPSGSVALIILVKTVPANIHVSFIGVITGLLLLQVPTSTCKSRNT